MEERVQRLALDPGGDRFIGNYRYASTRRVSPAGQELWSYSRADCYGLPGLALAPTDELVVLTTDRINQSDWDA